MGYMYGIWLVYNKDEFPTKHIGHFTITCFMEKEDAMKLYHELLSIYGKYQEIYVECANPLRFKPNMYVNDTNDLYSWGYEGHILENGMMTNLWSNIQEIATKYICNFSYKIHTTMLYSYSQVRQDDIQIGENKIVKCSIELVDITSDEPTDWHIISAE